MDLDERKSAILRAIVEEHVATAQPVGSQTVARSPGMNVSSATVRNEMTVLEREGYIVAAAHVGRADPHRPRLPLLRRPLHAPGRAPRSAEACGVRLLHAVHVGEPGARRSAARDEPAPRTGELAHRRRRGPALAPRGRDGPERAARQPPALARARARDPVERQRREVRAAPRRRGRRRNGGGGGRRARRAAQRRALVEPSRRDDHRQPGRRPSRDRSAQRARGARRARDRRAALRRRREPPRGGTRGVPHVRHRGAAARAARAPGRARRRSCATCSIRAPPSRSAPRTRSTSCATARSSSRRTGSTARSPARSACSVPPGWTTGRRWPRSRPSPNSSGRRLS